MLMLTNACYVFECALIKLCVGCDQACVGCMGSGPARCKKCARGFRLTGAKCLGKCVYGPYLDSFYKPYFSPHTFDAYELAVDMRFDESLSGFFRH